MITPQTNILSRNACSAYASHLPPNNQIGLEVCPDTGRDHWQAYMYFKNCRRFSTIKKMLPGAHIEKAKGSAWDNYLYCTKEDKDALVWGDMPEQGKRNDIVEALADVKAGMSELEVMEKHTDVFFRYGRGLQIARQTYEEAECPIVRDVSVECWWGVTDSGKTWAAVHDNPGCCLMSGSSKGTLWWDNYKGQSCLVLDEYYGGIPIGTMLRWLDKYKVDLPVKGRFTYARWTKVILLSNVDPS